MRPINCQEAEERGLAVEKGIHTFSNGSEWDSWSAHNCYECRWFNREMAGKDCAFEALAFLHMVSPELAELFGWVRDTEYADCFDAPEQCAFFKSRDDHDEDRPAVPPVIDPAQLTFIAPEEFPEVLPEPITVGAA